MKIISWNINGIKARYAELKQLVEVYRPDFLCMQKVKSSVGCLPYLIDGYTANRLPIDHGNWSGVATYARQCHLVQRIDTPSHSHEGHLQTFNCGNFNLLNAYVPYCNDAIQGADETRRQWNKQFIDLATAMSRETPVIICGDMNIIHQPIDTWDGIAVKNRGNYHQWEHDDFDRLLAEANLVDAFREIHPTLAKYSYFFQNKYKTTNQGGRLDYFLISSKLLPTVTNVDILTDFGTAPSAPIIIELNN